MSRPDPYMPRPLVILTVYYIAGIVLGRLWLEEPDQACWAAGLLLLASLLLLFRRVLPVFMAVLLLPACGAGAAAFIFATVPTPGGVLDYAGSPVYIEGTVVEEPLREAEDCTAYRLRVDTVQTREGRRPVTGTLLVKVYGEEQELYWFGERLRLRGTILEPKGRRNPGGFDYRFYLRSQGIDALVYPYPAQVSSLGAGETGWASRAVFSLRAQMTQGIENHLPSPAAELLIAVLFGQRQRLPESIQENFTKSGAGHLMAVSGLHVGLVAALILWLWRRLGLRGRLPLVPAMALVLAYACLTGLRPAALRAAIMICLALGALLLDRERDLPTAVALAALVTLAWNPLLLFTVGFQLSYAATLAIIYLYPLLQSGLRRLRLPPFLAGLLAVTMAAQLGVLPLCAYHFQHIPLGALFFNLLLLPLMAPVVGLGLAGALASLLPLQLPASIIFLACRPLLELMLLVTGLSRLPGFYRAVFPPPLPVLALYYASLAAALYLYYRYRPAAAAGQKSVLLLTRERIAAAARAFFQRPARPVIAALIVLVLLAAWPLLPLPSAGDRLTVTFIDVGQGAAALIESPCGATVLVDGGGAPPPRDEPGEVGERVLLPLLRYKRIRHLDLVIVSHPHEDHFGGLLPLVEAVPAGDLIISPVPGESPYYAALLERAAARGIPVAEAAAGETRSSGSLAIEFLFPPAKLLRGTGSDLNNNSLVARLQYGDLKLLFCGDIEDEAVQELMRGGADLTADILLVPHHGGFLEAMPGFLQAVRPRLAVIPVGTNTFGHPHPATLAALEDYGAAVYRTDLDGAVIVETDGTEIWVEAFCTDERAQYDKYVYNVI